MKSKFIIENYQTQLGSVPKVRTKLLARDYFGAIMVRWSINRNNYKVEPGIYAVGNPAATSDVFVTANYKLSFDHLRKNLHGLNAWILVLDTKGVNVWCAAGKGTFGTKELVNRVKSTSLEKLITHRRLILPQLGAVGIAAHEVKKQTESIQTAQGIENAFQQINKPNFSVETLTPNRGFNITYGPVRAGDIKAFIENNYKSTKEMRKVNFTLTDRIKLIPVDVIQGKYKLLAAFVLLLVLSGLSKTGISISSVYTNGIMAITNLFLAYVSGIIITPLLLPFIPVRSFATKGFWIGLLMSIVLLLFNNLGNNYFSIISWFLIITGVSSFVSLNFTGSSTYTSLSGVKKEMKVAIPFQISFASVYHAADKKGKGKTSPGDVP